jgi:hypothetical protein
LRLTAYTKRKELYMELKKPKQPTIQELEAEKRKLLQGGNPKRLKELIDYLDYFYYGIKKK